jgi:hypothetical protein
LVDQILRQCSSGNEAKPNRSSRAASVVRL